MKKMKMMNMEIGHSNGRPPPPPKKKKCFFGQCLKGGEMHHKCTQCKYASSTTTDLIMHKRTYTGEKPFKCKECGVSFSVGATLKNRVRTHTGEKVNTCNQCGHAFIKSGNLKVHLITHSGEKSHKCDECDHTTSSQQSLKVHKRTHAGEKPYKCDTCEFSGISSERLRSHMKLHMKWYILFSKSLTWRRKTSEQSWIKNIFFCLFEEGSSARFSPQSVTWDVCKTKTTFWLYSNMCRSMLLVAVLNK